MTDRSGIERLASKQMQLRESGKMAMLERSRPEEIPPVLTISRDFFCGGQTFARKLSETLQWKLYDKEIVESIADDRNTGTNLITSIDEKGAGPLQEWSNELFLRGYVGNAAYMKGLMKVVLSIAAEGNSIIVGRGSNFLLPDNRRVAIRLTAPMDYRVANYERVTGGSGADGRKILEEEDKRRAGFIRRVFRKEMADPMNYDLVINTGTVDFEFVQETVVRLLRSRFGAQAVPA